ncbi:MAG: DNA glycosylase AlkZ-like family protein, partial [Bacteroidia bacterium]
MKNIIRVISPEQARLLAIYNQGLLKPQFGNARNGALSAIQHLGYVQIDTLSVVARAHHHTLWSRLPDYEENYLSDLVNDKSIFEYWSHAASYLPMCDFRFSLPRKKAYSDGKSHWFGQD